MVQECGFTEESLKALAVKSQQSEEAGTALLVAVMSDEMKIRRHIDWNGKRSVGYVDFGNGITDKEIDLRRASLSFFYFVQCLTLLSEFCSR